MTGASNPRSSPPDRPARRLSGIDFRPAALNGACILTPSPSKAVIFALVHHPFLLLPQPVKTPAAA